MVSNAKYTHILRQIYSSSVFNFTNFYYGINIAFTTNVIYQLKQNNAFSEADASEIGASGFLLSFISCPIGGYILDKFGRKCLLLLIYIIFLVGWSIIAFTEYFVIGRYVTSIAIGMGFLCVVYTTEIVEPKYRGIISLSGSFFELLGAFGINFALYYCSWRTTAIGLAVLTLILLLNVFFIPESPYWLIMKNEREHAKKLLVWLRGDNDDTSMEAEIQEIAKNVPSTTKYSQQLTNVLRNTQNWKLLLIFGIYVVLTELNGYNMITPYSVQFFDTFNRTGVDSRVLTMMFSVISFVGTAVLMCFIEKIDRKVVLNLSNSVNVFFFGIAALQQTFFPFTEYSFIAVICILGFSVLVQLSVVLLPWIVISEALPNESRGVLYSILCAELYMLIYVFSLIFPKILASIEVKYILWTFCVVGGLNIVYVHFFMPETRGILLGHNKKK